MAYAPLGFERTTRLKILPLPSMARPAGGGLTQQALPKSGILAGIFLNIQGTVGGTVGAVNAWGMSSILRRLRVNINSGVDLINITGPGYHWLLRDMINGYKQFDPQTNGRAAVTAAATNLDVFLPIAVNNRDSLGMVMLQNEETIVNLEVDWESDTTVTATGTFTGFTCVPRLVVFEVPQHPEDRPDFSVVQQIIEDTVTIPAAGEYTYPWQRGNTILGQYHALQATTWTQARLRVQQSQFYHDLGPAQHRQILNSILERESDVAAGAITGSAFRLFWDFMGSDGLGAYGSVRDLLDTHEMTDIATVINVAATSAMINMRRQLVRLQ